MIKREILFRGKRLNNGEWVEGYFIRQYGSNEIITADDEIYHIAPDSLCEYTGLKDKNGTRLFEGDIVRYKNTLHEVVFCRIGGCAFFGITMPGRGEIWNFDGITRADRMEVIGNVHDNGHPF